MTDLTRILADVESGRTGATDELLAVVYDELRAIAANKMAGERPDHTLQATALVHEAFVRLVGTSSFAVDSRARFFLAAAEAMRRILIDHARRRGRQKRGGNLARASVDVAELAAEKNFEEMMAVDEALRRLEGHDERAATIVRLRFFAGLSVDDTADVMSLSPRTVAREWAYARAWLFDAIAGKEPADHDQGEPPRG